MALPTLGDNSGRDVSRVDGSLLLRLDSLHFPSAEFLDQATFNKSPFLVKAVLISQTTDHHPPPNLLWQEITTAEPQSPKGKCYLLLKKDGLFPGGLWFCRGDLVVPGLLDDR